MALSPVTHALIRKHAELAGEIEHHKHRIAKLRSQLASVDATLCMMAPDVDPRVIVPKRYRNGRQVFRPRALTRMLYEVLRAGPCDLDAITLFVMRKSGMDADNPILRKDIRRRVRYALRDQAKAGRLVLNSKSWGIADQARSRCQ